MPSRYRVLVLEGFLSFLWLGSKVVMQWIANPLYAGSIPALASILDSDITQNAKAFKAYQ